MTRGELELAWAYDRTLYYGTAPVKVQQLCSPWSKSDTATVRSASNPKGRQWRCSFDELSATPKKRSAQRICSELGITVTTEEVSYEPGE